MSSVHIIPHRGRTYRRTSEGSAEGWYQYRVADVTGVPLVASLGVHWGRRTVAANRMQTEWWWVYKAPFRWFTPAEYGHLLDVILQDRTSRARQEAA